MQQLDERLKGQYASLSPQEQRVADFIFDHFDDLISYNSAELAQRAACRKPPSAGCLASVTTNIRICAMNCALCVRAGCRSPTSATRCG